jgi:hypothetical protein
VEPLPRPYTSYQHLYVAAGVSDKIPFFEPVLPPMNSSTNRTYIEHFNQFFEIIPNESVESTIKSLPQPLIGIHIRSLAQKHEHKQDYLATPLEDRLRKVADVLPIDASIFVMTDVDKYLTKAKEIFSRPIYFIENVERIPTGDADSVPLFENPGYKLGADILNECYAMSLCDRIYVSDSNIPFLITMMKPDIEMVEY